MTTVVNSLLYANNSSRISSASFTVGLASSGRFGFGFRLEYSGTCGSTLVFDASMTLSPVGLKVLPLIVRSMFKQSSAFFTASLVSAVSSASIFFGFTLYYFIHTVFEIK